MPSAKGRSVRLSTDIAIAILILERVETCAPGFSGDERFGQRRGPRPDEFGKSHPAKAMAGKARAPFYLPSNPFRQAAQMAKLPELTVGNGWFFHVLEAFIVAADKGSTRCGSWLWSSRSDCSWALALLVL